jgi:APA family basic amino acid/polyamine antiporter
LAATGVRKKLTSTNWYHAPAALMAQGIWTAVLTLPRTVIVNSATGQLVYGNVYTQLLKYFVSAD